MAATTPNKILLQVNGADRPDYHDKQAATATIKPGMLIELASATTVTPVATADKTNTRMIALEVATAPDVTQPAINQAYASGDNVRYFYAAPGDLVYMWLTPAQTAVIGSVLASSAAAGELSVEATNVGHNVIGIAEEAVTTTGAAARIKVRIL
ncbi:MAG: hypothetical protein WBC13_00805 [Dokdonella sp.]